MNRITALYNPSFIKEIIVNGITANNESHGFTEVTNTKLSSLSHIANIKKMMINKKSTDIKIKFL